MERALPCEFLLIGKGDVERSAFATMALEPDPAAVSFNDLLDDCESDACSTSTVRRQSQTLKYVEDALVILNRDSSTRVVYGDVVAVMLLDDRHDDARLAANPHVVDRVAD